MRTLDAVILGWTPGAARVPDSFGALLLGALRRRRSLRWIGQVGTGFTGRLLADLRQKLEAIEIDEPTIGDRELRAVKGAHWVKPELVCEVSYLEITKAGKLRAPSYKGLRPDKTPEDCQLEDAG